MLNISIISISINFLFIIFGKRIACYFFQNFYNNIIFSILLLIINFYVNALMN